MGVIIPGWIVSLTIIITIIMILQFYPWYISVAFALAIALVPSFILSLNEIFRVLFFDKQIDFKEVFAVGAIFSFVGIPIYLIIVMPVYSILLKFSQFPIIFTFPSAVVIIMLLIFSFLITEPWNHGLWKYITGVLIITGCSVLHSFFILWLISKLKLFSL